MNITPTQTAQAVWILAIGILLAYEAWALTRGYHWTLTAGMRAWIGQAQWLIGVLAAVLAWLFAHFAIERRKEDKDADEHGND